MKNPTKSSQPRYNVAGRYAALLDAGEVLLCQEYDKAQPRLIAETAGVSVGLFYRHFKNKQEMLTDIMVKHLEILHSQVAQELQQDSEPVEALHTVLLFTLRYFHQHQGIIKLFFLQIGYGDLTATEKLKKARQTYRDILLNIIEDGIAQGIFLPPEVLDVQLAINSIIGTINWSVYDLLIVKNETLEPEEFAQKLLSYILRSLRQ